MNKVLYIVGDYHCPGHFDRCSDYLKRQNIDFDVFSMCNLYAIDSFLYLSDDFSYLVNAFCLMSSPKYSEILAGLHSSLKNKLADSSATLFIPRRDLQQDNSYHRFEQLQIDTGPIRNTGKLLSIQRLVNLCVSVDLSLAFGLSSVSSSIDTSILYCEYVTTLMQLSRLLASRRYSAVVTYNSYGYCLASNLLAHSLSLKSYSFSSTLFLPLIDNSSTPYKFFPYPVRTYLQRSRDIFESCLPSQSSDSLSSSINHPYIWSNESSSPMLPEKQRKFLVIMSGLTEKLAEISLASDMPSSFDSLEGSYLLNSKIKLVCSYFHWFSQLNKIAKYSHTVIHVRRHPNDYRYSVPARSSQLVYNWISKCFSHLTVGPVQDANVNDQILDSDLIFTFGSSLALDAVKMKRKVICLERSMSFLPDIPGIYIHASMSKPIFNQIMDLEQTEISDSDWMNGQSLFYQFYHQCVS